MPAGPISLAAPQNPSATAACSRSALGLGSLRVAAPAWASVTKADETLFSFFASSPPRSLCSTSTTTFCCTSPSTLSVLLTSAPAICAAASSFLPPSLNSFCHLTLNASVRKTCSPSPDSTIEGRRIATSAGLAPSRRSCAIPSRSSRAVKPDRFTGTCTALCVFVMSLRPMSILFTSKKVVEADEDAEFCFKRPRRRPIRGSFASSSRFSSEFRNASTSMCEYEIGDRD